MTTSEYKNKGPFRNVIGFIFNPGMIFLYITVGLSLVLSLPEEKRIDLPTEAHTERSRGSLLPVLSETGPRSGGKAGIQQVSLKSIDSYPGAGFDAAPPGFELIDATLESGIKFTHIQTSKMLTALNELIGSGACVADIDQDGYMDIYVVNGSGFAHYYGKKWWWSKTPNNVLYRNQGDGTFKDISKKAGVENNGFGMGCVFGDFNNDGYADLYVTNYGANILYHNNGDGTFTDVTDKAGVGDERWGTSAAWADYDQDGDLDLYVVNYVVFDKTMTPGEPNSAFKMVKPLLMNSALFDGEKNVLYRNNGDSTFTDVTDKAGVANSPGKGMGVVFVDYDIDGDQDIYIVNDKSRNVLYINNGDGTFTDLGGFLGVDSPLSGMGVTVGDYDNDGDPDIFSTYSQSDTNILYRNLSVNKDSKYKKDGFIDTTVDAGLGEEVSVGYFGWSTEFVDIDNDGYLDIFVANGHGMVDYDNPQATIGQANQLFMNNGNGTFSDISGYAGKSLKTLRSSRGAAVADFDNDGDIDFFVVNNNGESQYLENRNMTNNHWINISLAGKDSNSAGIGAKIVLTTENMKQTRQVRSGSGYLSQMDTRIHFGIGDSSVIREIEIAWPSGNVQKFKDIEVDSFITITEGSNELAARKFPQKRRKIQVVKKTKAGKKPEDENFVMRMEAVNTLSLIPGGKSFEILTGLLKDKNPWIKQEAVRALGRLGNTGAVDHLLVLYRQETEKELRREIINALGHLYTDKTIEPIMEALLGQDVNIRRQAALILSSLFEKEDAILRSSILKKRLLVSTLIKLLNDPDTEVRKYALRSLGYSESYRAVMPVITAFGDRNTDVQEEAVRTSGLLRDRRATESLLILLRNPDTDEKVKVQAVFALKRLESDVVLEPLFEAATHGKKEERMGALKVMFTLLKDKESVLINKGGIVNFLQKGMEDSEQGIRMSVLDIAGRLNRDAVKDIVIKGLHDHEVLVRRKAALVGRELKHPEILNELIKLSRDEDMEIRKEAVLAMSAVSPDPDNINRLEEIIDNNSNSEIHITALSSLIKISSSSAIQYIEREIEKKAESRKELIEVLELTGNIKAMDILVSCLGNYKDAGTNLATVQSLKKFIKKKKAFSAILRIIRDEKKDVEVRQAALALMVNSGQKNQTAMIFPVMSRILKNKKDPLRDEVIHSLLKMKEKKGVPLLLEIFKDKADTLETRKLALSALADLAPTETLSEIEKQLI